MSVCIVEMNPTIRALTCAVAFSSASSLGNTSFLR